MPVKAKLRLEEIICNYIIKNQEFPFELFGVNKEEAKSEYGDDYKFVISHSISPAKTLINVSYYKDTIEFYEITLSLDGEISYFSSFFRKIDEKLVECERNIKFLERIRKPDLEKILSNVKYEGDKNVSHSKRIVRDLKNLKIANIEYANLIYFHPKKAYEKVELDSDCLLNSVGFLDFNEIQEKIENAEEHEKERENLRKNVLDIKGNTILERNKNFIEFANRGLTLDEIATVVRKFVDNLPQSIDPLSGSFFPGNVYFKQPTDLYQLNNKRFDYDGYRTIFDGMIKWNDTHKAARTIALCTLFQEMLLSDRTDYSIDEIITFMKSKKIMKKIEEVNKTIDKEYLEYATKENELLTNIAKEMINDIKVVSEKRGKDREEALNKAYKNILKAEGAWPLIKDLELYYHSQGISTNIAVAGFNTIPKDLVNTKNLLPLLDKIYYRNFGKALNSKKMYMIQVAMAFLKDRDKAIEIVNKNYKFNVRKVDVVSNYLTQEKHNHHR